MTTRAGSTRNIRFAVVDLSQQKKLCSAFLEKSCSQMGDVIVAYKPKRHSFAQFRGKVQVHSVKEFVTDVLEGALSFHNAFGKLDVQ